MPLASKPTTVVSTKGQVILPKAVRDHHKWSPGTRLIVDETPEGVLLRAEPLFPATTIAEVRGSLKYDGPPLTIEQMDEGVLAEARRRGRD
jgi:AbrB family looped-hinge helix DNA binding protein